MQTEKGITLNPETILMQYEKYDVGEVPYTICKDENGNLKAVPFQVLDSIKSKAPRTTNNPVREVVLKLVRGGKTSELIRLANDMVDYLVFGPDEKKDSFFPTKTMEFRASELRFTQFLIDLPEDISYDMMEKLIRKEKTDEKRRDIIEMVDKRQQMNVFNDVVFELFRTKKRKV